MRLVMFFEKKEEAKEFMKKHKEYKLCDKVDPPIRHEDGKLMNWVTTAIVE